MKYATTIKVLFPFAASTVYTALVDLSRYPLWNSGMISIEPPTVMQPGMVFKATSVVTGIQNHSTVVVVRLEPDKAIELKSQSGAVPFVANYDLTEVGPHSTQLLCVLDFEVTGIALKFALPVIQSMANARLTGDFETLKALLAE